MASIISAGTTSGTALNMAGDTSGVLQLATNGSTTALTVDTSQNVGIGTTSPTNFGSNFKMLAVQGSDYGVIQGISNSGSTTVEMMGASGIGYVGTRTNHPLALRTNDTERMRIDTSGNVGIGITANPDNNRLQVKQSAANACVGVYAGTGSPGGLVNWYKNDNTYLASVTFSGATVTYGTGSDYRLKENIMPIGNALEKVSALKPVSFNWKDDGSYGESFIAHELQELYPTAVNGTKDAVDSEGNPRYQGIDPSKLVALLTAAIQEQQTIINDLKARITALEGAA